MDLLTKDRPVVLSHISFQNTVGQEMPTDPAYYPGKVSLERERHSEDDDELTRRAKEKLRKQTFMLESSPSRFLSTEERERIRILQQMQIDPREVEHFNKRQLKNEGKKNREHFLGMGLAEMLVAAKRDPFNLPVHHLKTPRNAEAEGRREGESLVNLSIGGKRNRADLEESIRSLSQSDLRKRVLNSGLYKKEPQMVRRVSRSGNSVIDINDSDYIDDAIGIADDLDFGTRRSSKSESMIEDLVSRSYSNRAKGGIIRSKSRGKLEELNQRGGIADNESSGFGLIKPNPTNTVGIPNTKEFRVATEESDSDPFGLGMAKPKDVGEQSPNIAAGNKKFESNFSNTAELDNNKGHKEKQFREPIQNFGDIGHLGANPPTNKTLTLELDPRIYEDITAKYEYIPREPEIFKSSGALAKIISQGFSSIQEELKANQEFIEDAGAKIEEIKKRTQPGLKEEAVQKYAGENERVTKKLLNKISLAREKNYDPKFIEQILEELALPNIGEPMTSPIQPVDNWQYILQKGPQVFPPLSPPFTGHMSPIQMLARGKEIATDVSPTHESEPFTSLYDKAMQCRENLVKVEEGGDEQKLVNLQKRVEALKSIEAGLGDTLGLRRQETATFKQRELEKVRQKVTAERNRRELLAREQAIREQLREAQKAKDKEKEGSYNPQPSVIVGSPPSREREKKEVVKPQVVPPLAERSRVWDAHAEHQRRVPELTEEESVNSATVLSDYPERDEQLESISWMDSIVSKQRKFTNFN